MGRGDSSWWDRNHHLGKPIGGKKTSTGTIARFFKKTEGVTETPPTVDTSVGLRVTMILRPLLQLTPLETLRLVRVS